ncbi:D-TA family PLP-dependent enzyme [Daejeonella sp. JGW-45]|uniref:D-TA family PLP-dependent enzyme n=1 Tax=Daejeonella sp. JGW-45 TaxID=3034148 RepID=UPI0023EBA91E|nr:D-TA family PLP-dependent enzyme [Daejeonella sp. JGW-45]
MHWYTVKNAENIDSPALLVYKDRALDNIRQVLTMVRDPKQLRPHVKTHKLTEICRMMQDAGIRKFKAASIAEAEMLGIAGAEDVMLAYQPGRPKFLRFLNLIREYPGTRYSCLLDNIESGRMFADLFSNSEAAKRGAVLPVFIDLNVGMNRTGIKPGAAYGLFNDIQSLRELEFKGFHAYDGHIRDVDLAERTAHCENDFKEAEVLREKIKEEGGQLPLLVAGGSPTFAIHSKKVNTECCPGTFVFWDKGYRDTLPEQDFKYAALVMTRVVSLPAENKICIDLGYKSVASENELTNRVGFLNYPELKPSGHSEEHMVIEVEKGHSFKIGDIFYAVPVHICPTVALFENALVVQDGELTDTWRVVARDRVITY